jgi:hypothetical protein
VISISLDRDGSGESYDKALSEVSSGCDHTRGLEVISKARGTVNGAPIVMLRFWASTPEGQEAFPVACMVTLKEFLGAAQALQGCHGSPGGSMQVIGTEEADPFKEHARGCGLRGGGVCTCRGSDAPKPTPSILLDLRKGTPGEAAVFRDMIAEVAAASDGGDVRVRMGRAMFAALERLKVPGAPATLNVWKDETLLGNDFRVEVAPKGCAWPVQHAEDCQCGGCLHVRATKAMQEIKDAAEKKAEEPRTGGLRQPFDYGPKKWDGQHSDHPSLPAEERGKMIRPLRLSYRHEKCGNTTKMPQKCAETYAAQPSYYGSTFCCHCKGYFPVGAAGEFVWLDDGSKVGT